MGSYKILFYPIMMLSFVLSEVFIPSDNKTLHTTHIRFKWPQIPNTNYYNLIATSGTTASSINVIDSTTSFIDKSSFGWDEIIYWYVDAYDTLGYIISRSDTLSFYTGNQKFPGSEMNNVDTNLAEGGITIFGTWWDFISGAVDENGVEIWNDGGLNVMLNFVDQYGQMFGSQVFPDDNVWMRGIQFDTRHNVVHSEPWNTGFDPHDLRRLSNGDLVGLKHTTQMGPIPPGPWTEHYQNLGYIADGETEEILWGGQKIRVVDHLTGEILWDWNPFDHYLMDDVDLDAGTWWWAVWNNTYDWLHSNSIFFDESDSSFYYSNRHISRISKINYPSGEIEWMMGLPTPYMPSGDEHICSELLFSFQHEVDILPNGNMLIYDNGVMSDQLINIDERISRILEVAIHDDGSCELVWEYVFPDELFAIGMGSVELLDNGNLNVTSGNQCGTLFEITRQGDIVWQTSLGLENCDNALYRSYRVKTLYPRAVSVMLNNYTYLDLAQTIKGVNTDSEGVFSFAVHNDAGKDLNFIYQIHEIFNNGQEEMIYNGQDVTVLSSDGKEIVDVNLGQLSNGLHKLKLSVRVEPFYGETEEITFYIMNNSQLNIDNEKIIPKIMSSNYPNPFNPVTNIIYNLPEDGFVKITVYDILGNIIKNLVSENQSSGYKSIQWNAKNNQGQPVSAGVYLYSIEEGDFIQTKKMILLK